MDTSIIATLIGLLGGGAVGALGFILTGIRAELRTTGERLKADGESIARIDERTKADSERLGRLEKGFVRLEEGFGRLAEGFVRFEEHTISKFGHIEDVLTRIEATQAEQGRMLEGHGRMLEGHGRMLEGHDRLLEKLAGGDAS